MPASWPGRPPKRSTPTIATTADRRSRKHPRASSAWSTSIGCARCTRDTAPTSSRPCLRLRIRKSSQSCENPKISSSAMRIVPTTVLLAGAPRRVLLNFAGAGAIWATGGGTGDALISAFSGIAGAELMFLDRARPTAARPGRLQAPDRRHVDVGERSAPRVAAGRHPRRPRRHPNLLTTQMAEACFGPYPIGVGIRDEPAASRGRVGNKGR